MLLLAFCALGGIGISYAYPMLGAPWVVISVALLLGGLLILVDMLLKGFSLRGLSALTFGLAVGILASHLISISPLFEGGDSQMIFVSRVGVFIFMTYLSAVIALRGKDEFNLVIPYVRFTPERVEAPIVVVDDSCLVDGRVSKLCAARMLGDVISVPRFVLDELSLASVSDAEEEANRGRRGLKTLSELRGYEHLEVRVFESDLSPTQSREDKLLFVTSSLKGRLLSANSALIDRAEQEGVPYVDMLGLSKALSAEVSVGDSLTVKLARIGKEDSQGVGYIEDGSMVVVNRAADLVGSSVMVEVESIIPTSGGRMIFGNLLGEALPN